MKCLVEINFTEQAELALKNMPNINRDFVINWFINKRGIFIGGGDIYDYLRSLEVGDNLG